MFPRILRTFNGRNTTLRKLFRTISTAVLNILWIGYYEDCFKKNVADCRLRKIDGSKGFDTRFVEMSDRIKCLKVTLI